MELHLTLRQPCTGTQAMQTTKVEGVERLGFLFIFCVPNHRGLTPDTEGWPTAGWATRALCSPGNIWRRGERVVTLSGANPWGSLP